MNPIKMFWGLVLGGVGFLLLGIEIGWWNSSVLLNVLSFWPVILIVIGLSFIVNDDVVLSILIIAILVGVGYLAINGKNTVFGNYFYKNENSVSNQDVNENLNSSTRKAFINLNFGAAKLELSALKGDESKIWLTKISGQNLWKLSSKREDKNNETSLTVTEEAESLHFINRERTATVGLTTTIPLDLVINTGASTANVDLSELKVENFELNSGANSGDIKFGKLVSMLNAKIKTGASSITIRAPKEVGLKIDYDKSALNNQNFANGISLNQVGENQYETSGYKEAVNKINLEISAGVSSIHLVQY